MSLSIQDKLKIINKKLLDKKSTSNINYQYFEEQFDTYNHISPNQIWYDSDLLPIINPLFESGDGEIYFSDNKRIFKKIEKKLLQKYPSTKKSFYINNLNNIIPESFGINYNTKIFHYINSEYNEILKEDILWNIDYETGIIYFEDGLSTNISEKSLYITTYQYIGRLGIPEYNTEITGIQGFMGNRGNRGFQGKQNEDYIKYKGIWNNSNTYNFGDLVKNSNNFFISKINLNNYNTSDNTKWIPFTSSNSSIIPTNEYIKYVSPNYQGKNSPYFNTIQSAINSCNSNDGKYKIIINRGIYNEDLLLKNNIDLYFNDGSVLKGSSNNNIYAIEIPNNCNTSIYGNGEINLYDKIAKLPLKIGYGCNVNIHINCLKFHKDSESIINETFNNLRSNININIKKISGVFHFLNSNIVIENTFSVDEISIGIIGSDVKIKDSYIKGYTNQTASLNSFNYFNISFVYGIVSSKLDIINSNIGSVGTYTYYNNLYNPGYSRIICMNSLLYSLVASNSPQITTSLYVEILNTIHVSNFNNTYYPFGYSFITNGIFNQYSTGFLGNTNSHKLNLNKIRL